MAQTQRLQFIIDAQNKADAALKGVSNSLEKVKSNVESFEPAFKKMSLVGTVAFGAISALAISSFKASADAAAQMSLATNVVRNALENLSDEGFKKLKKEAGALEHPFEMVTRKMKEAGKAAVQLAFDDETAATAFAKLFQITGDTAKAQDELNLAMDLARYSGRDLESAVDALVKVHAGGTRVLKEFGIEVKEGTTATEAFGIVSQKVAGSAKTFADSAAGGMERMKVQVDNLRESVGDALAPAFQKVFAAIEPLLLKFAEWAEANPELLAKIVLITGALAGLTAGVGLLGLALPGIITGIGAISTALMFLAANPIVLVVGGLALLAMKFNELIEVTGGFSNAVVAMGDTIIAWWKKSGEWIYGKIQGLLDLYTKLINKAGDIGGSLLSKVGIGKRATGGPVGPGGAYLVGEKGPELFSPSTYGKISNAGKTSGMGGLNITITGNSFVGEEGIAEKIGAQIMKALQLRMKIAP